jgi:DNA-binding response OmpR family regulator
LAEERKKKPPQVFDLKLTGVYPLMSGWRSGLPIARNAMSMFKAKKKRILVVDDEQAIGDITCEFLKEAGFDATFVTNAVDAMHRMEEKPFDAMLLDIYLEQDDGLLFLSKFKKSFPSVPVIMLTGAGYDEDMMETALKEGASGYVSKDTDLDNIVVAIQRVLRQTP